MEAATAAEVRIAWGRRLRALRRRQQRSQEQVAEQSGLDQSAVSRAESGKSDLDTYLKIAAATGTTLADITSGEFADQLDAECA